MERFGSRNAQNGNGEKQRQDYTFLNLKHSVSKDGKPYDSVTFEAKVMYATELKQTGQNKQVINFKAPFTLTENKQKKLMSFFGVLPTAGEKGTTWVKVAMWDSLADRFNKKCNKVKEMTVVVTGSIKLVQSGEQGQFLNLEINADDFMVVSEVKDEAAPDPNQQGGQPAYQQQPYQQPYQAPVQQPAYQQAPQQMAPQYQQPQQVAPQPVYQAQPVQQAYQQPAPAPVYEAPIPAPIPEPEPAVPANASLEAAGFVPVEDANEEDLPF